jgi:predicted chitinase
MARDNSKDVTHQQTMSKLSEKSKQTSASLLNSTKATPKALADSGDMDGVLGQIYQLMVDNRKDELEQRQIDEKNSKTDTRKEESRHQELLKALTVRRRPKPKRVIRREKKAEEKEAAKPTTPAKKPAEAAKKPAEAAKKPPEPAKKPPEPAKKPAEDTAKKAAEDKAKKAAEDKAKKEAEDRAKKAAEDKAKKAAEDRAKKEAEDKAKKAAEDKAKREAEDKAKKEAEDRAKKAAEDKAKKSAEQVKPPEVKPPPKAEQVKPPEVKPPPKAEAAPAAPKPAQVKPPPKAEQVKPPPKAPTTKIPPISGGKGVVIAALLAAGLSAKAQANVLAQVEAESNFVPKSEDLYYSADGLANTWPNRFGQKGPDGKLLKDKNNRVLPNQIATDIAKNPEKIAEAVYGKRKDLGNTADGDGFKYRGRGFLQITGKDAYKSLGDYIGVDLVGDPDKLNEISVAAKSIPWFFLKYKGYLIKKPQDLENIGTVSKAVGFQDKKLKSGEMESEHRAKLAEKYQAEVSSTPVPSSDTGTKVDQSSKENADLKEKLNKDKSAQTTNNTTTTNKQTNNVQSQQKVDDRPPHVRKQQQ